MADTFNLSGELLVQEHFQKVHRADDGQELPMSAESELRNLLSAKGVHPVIQARVIADATAKAAPGYMEKFFPPRQPAKKYAVRESGVFA